jgi:hypothetical protein
MLKRTVPAALSGLDKDGEHGWNKALQPVGGSDLHASLRMRERDK